VVGVSYLLLFAATGFDPIATFRAALETQKMHLKDLVRPYPRTIVDDLQDFALGCGWLGVLLAILSLFGPRDDEVRRRDRALTILCFGQLVLLAVTGLMQTETARTWCFLTPLVALPAWRTHRTQPIDERDVIESLARAATAPDAAGRSLDVAGPDVVSYGELVTSIRDHMLVRRPLLRIGRMGPLSSASVTSAVAAAIAGEQRELVGPLMAGLTSDLLPRDDSAAGLLGVRLHSLDAAIEHALREWEHSEPLAAR
jgi:hypothetical protein